MRSCDLVGNYDAGGAWTFFSLGSKPMEQGDIVFQVAPHPKEMTLILSAGPSSSRTVPLPNGNATDDDPPNESWTKQVRRRASRIVPLDHTHSDGLASRSY
jgi:hypothetical protein